MRPNALLLLLLAVVPRAPGMDRRAAVIHLYQSGVTGSSDIAQRVQCTDRWVRQVIADAGLRLPVHPQLGAVVAREARRLGTNYGVIMMQGVLRAAHPGYAFPRAAVRDALRMANPAASAMRRNWARQRLARGHYHAPHYMYSVHIDFACKMQLYGIFIAAAVDG